MYTQKEKEERLFYFRLSRLEMRMTNLFALVFSIYILGVQFLVESSTIPKPQNLTFLGIGVWFIVVSIVYGYCNGKKIERDYEQLEKEFIENIPVEEHQRKNQ